MLARIWKDMRSYARIGKKGFCRENLIKPRKNEDMQGYETIWKEKLKFSWYATAVFAEISKFPCNIKVFQA